MYYCCSPLSQHHLWITGSAGSGITGGRKRGLRAGFRLQKISGVIKLLLLLTDTHSENLKLFNKEVCEKSTEMSSEAVKSIKDLFFPLDCKKVAEIINI